MARYVGNFRFVVVIVLLELSWLATLGGSSAWSAVSISDVGDEDSIQFSSDLHKTLTLAKSSRKPVVLAFGAVWCPHCRRMKTETIAAPEVRAIAGEFYWVYVEIDRSPSLARSYNVQAIPQFFLLDPDGNVRKRFTGMIGPGEFRGHLQKFLDQMRSDAKPGAEAPIEAAPISSQTPLFWTPTGYRSQSVCFSHVGYGPLRVESQSPFQSLRHGLVPRTPSTLVKGQFQASASGTWVNIWAHDQGDYLLDFEMLQSKVSLAYGITDTLQAEIELGNRSQFGGAMDGFIQGFHDLFNIDQNGRDKVPRGDFVFDIEAADGQPSVSLDKGMARQSLLFTLQHNLTCGTEELPALSYAFDVRFDLSGSDEVHGNSAPDLGASVAVARRFSDAYYTYLTVGFAWFGEDDFYGIDLRRTQLSGLAAFEWRWRANMSLVLQYLITQGVAKTRSPFSQPSHEVTLGWKGEISRDTVLEIGIIENIIIYENSPDFGVHVGLIHRF